MDVVIHGIIVLREFTYRRPTSNRDRGRTFGPMWKPVDSEPRQAPLWGSLLVKTFFPNFATNS